MARRIEVELTSKRDDGRWTWRAAGAKQPKGELDASLLYEGARAGDVVRAEADFGVEGIVVVAVVPPENARPEPERVQIVGPPRDEREVISTLTSKPERGRQDRPERPDRPRGEHRGGAASRARGGEDRASGRRDQPGRGGDDARRGGGPRGDAPARTTRPSGGRGPRPDAPGGQGRRTERPARPEKPAPTSRFKRLSPASTHRDAVLASLAPEELPIAEQALRGGLPGVRQAVQAQNSALREQGQPEVKAQPLLAIAERLLPRLKAADWRDRAEAAVLMVDDLSLRDLRSVVMGADTARDDEGRVLAGTLREALERRLRELNDAWIADITTAIDEGHLVQALRASARPPDPALRFPSELALRLSEAASAAMAADAPADRWQALLEAVADSPVRRSVKPAGLPEGAPDSVLQAARQASGKVPALAGLLGIAMPPPPGPPRPTRPGAGATRQRRSSSVRPGRPPIPPPPPATAAVEAADAATTPAAPAADPSAEAPAPPADLSPPPPPPPPPTPEVERPEGAEPA